MHAFGWEVLRPVKMGLDQRPIRIGEFRFDPAAQRLWRNDEAIDLVPQVSAVLLFLVERAGQLVTKEEMLQAAWGGVVVSDMALSQAVRRLRTAFGDDARAPRYVETVHRRGFRLVAPVGVASYEVGPADDAALFVGRESERARLAGLWQAARGAARKVVFIEGEAGIGKTALLRSFLSGLVGVDVRVADARCGEQQGSAEPYMPVLEALDRLARSSPDAVEVLRRYAPTWLVQMPWLLDPEEARGLKTVLNEATRARMVREMARALEVVSEARPLVLVLEDLHWADQATLDLLGSIARRREAARLMVVATYRPAEAIAYQHPIVGLVRALWTSGACTRIGLSAFDPAEVEAYLAGRFSARRLAATLAERMHARSEGNPLFLVAMVDHLVERGFLAEDGNGWRLARSIEEHDLRDIPYSLREMIELQLSSLERSDLELLQAASVAAVEFRAASVAAALERSGPEGLEAVENACERLIARRHLLRATGEQTWPDGTRTATYGFSHQLYRQALYESLPVRHRRRFHQRIGQRLEQAFAGDPRRVATELAMHFHQSGDDARAVAYFVLAARQAHRRFADREAAPLLRNALAHSDALPAGRARDFGELQMRIGIVLAHWLADVESPEEDEQHLVRIRALTPALDGSRDSFQVCRRLWTVYSFRSLPDLAAPLADRMAANSAGGTEAERMEAYNAKGTTALMQGRFAEGTAYQERAFDAYHGDGPTEGATSSGYEPISADVGFRVHGNLGLALLLSGALDQASLHIGRAIELCAGRVHPKLAAAGYTSSAGLLCLLDRLEPARAASDRGLEIAEEHALTKLLAAAAPQRVWLAVRAGTVDDAGATIEAAWQGYLRTRNAIPAAASPLLLADACRMAGTVDLGLTVVETVWRDTRESGLRWYDAELRRLEGELILLRGGRHAHAEAAARFHDALGIAQAQGGRFYELRAATSLARLEHGRRNESGARDNLARLYGSFTEGFSTAPLRDAAECLRECAPNEGRLTAMPLHYTRRVDQGV